MVFLGGAPVAGAAMGELPFTALPDRAVATCLRSTGPAGPLALLGSAPGGRWPVDLFDVGAAGVARGERVDVGRLAQCPAAATATGGSAVVAGVIASRRESLLATQVRATARDPGGVFGAPVTLDRGPYDSAVSAAVSPGGQAVVAWAQRSGPPLGGRVRMRFVASRRAPGGTFGPVEPLTPWRTAGDFGEPSLATAIDATGTATVAWLRPLPDTRRMPDTAALETATARPGGRFAGQRVAERVQEADRPALAVAGDGWALLAVDGIDGLAAYERPPGAERFAAVAVPPPQGVDPSGGPGDPVAAIRDGGGAVVAWRTGFGDQDGVAAATRTGAGPFARARTVAPAPRSFGLSQDVVVLSGSGPPQDADGGRLQAALGPNGRALLAWTAADDLGVSTLKLRVAAGTLADGFEPPARLGTPLRSAGAVAPLFLPDGRAALAWTDNAGGFEPSSLGERDGRLHLALESAPAPPALPPPRISLRAHSSQRLFASSPLRVRVRCDRACDIYATVRGSHSAVTASISHAASVALRLQRGDRTRIGRHREIVQTRRGRLRIVVRAAAPNGHRIATASRTVLVRARPALAIPPPIAVRARRAGGSITVTWRTAHPARRTLFIVEPRRSRRGRSSITELIASRRVDGRGRMRFRVRLHPQRPQAIRWVTVTALSPDDQTSRRVTVVPVRG